MHLTQRHRKTFETLWRCSRVKFAVKLLRLVVSLYGSEGFIPVDVRVSLAEYVELFAGRH